MHQEYHVNVEYLLNQRESFTRLECAIRPGMIYGTKCWAIKKLHLHKKSMAKMRMLR